MYTYAEILYITGTFITYLHCIILSHISVGNIFIHYPSHSIILWRSPRISLFPSIAVQLLNCILYELAIIYEVYIFMKYSCLFKMINLN